MKQTESDIYYHGPVVVFDLDDTLFSEKEFAESAYREVASQPDIAEKGLSERVVEAMTNALERRANPFDVLIALLESNGVNPHQSVEDYLKIYRAHTPTALTLYPDALAMLEGLRKRGVKCGIITDGRSHTQRAKIKSLGIEDYFHPADILISEETGHDKTEADNFISIVHHYPEAQKFIYIGDNPAKDFENPSLLGWETYCLRDKGQNIHPQNGSSDDYEMIDSFAEIIL